MDHLGPKHVQPPSVVNKLNHKTLYIWLVYIYIYIYTHTLKSPEIIIIIIIIIITIIVYRCCLHYFYNIPSKIRTFAMLFTGRFIRDV